ncbi:hypothetical protein ACFYO5_35700 [Streptomyces sp. NPDC006259]|uniref:hypothetical protein n=1 Tax=Streptomyces sp. NPDC006259 TaxID=3364740 RepID=UPI0036CC1F4D
MTIDNDVGRLERTLAALGRPAWDVTPEDIDRVVGDLAVRGRATEWQNEVARECSCDTLTGIARQGAATPPSTRTGQSMTDTTVTL